MALSVVQVIGNVALGGAEAHLLDLVDGLAAFGVYTRVVCPRPGPLSETLERRGVPVEFVEIVRPRAGDEYALDRVALSRCAALFRAWSPDLVHSHLYPAHLHASLAALEAGVPAIVQTAHTLVVRNGDRIVQRLTDASSIATSQAVADVLVGADLPASRVEVIYNGVRQEYLNVDAQATRRARSELNIGDRPVIGTVARLSPEKGVDALLRALVAVVERFPALIALIVGDGPQARALRRLADELGLGDNVAFLGARTDVAVLDYLMDVFVLASREEACSMALLEAMAAGRAIVATCVGGSPELIADGVGGLLVQPDEPAALAAAVIGLLENGQRRKKFGAAARHTVAEQFTRERMVSRTNALYERLLAV
jgi:glycosyltransferase involved in cell wall biosynthesis